MEQAITHALFLILGYILARLGQGKVNTPKEYKIPKMTEFNPMELYKQKEEKKQAEREQKIYQANLENINNYNGTSDHQKEIPKE